MTATLQDLYFKHFGKHPVQIDPLPQSGSHRRYFRLSDGKHSAIGTIGTDLKENLAFIGFSRHFYKAGLRVPEILAVAADEMAYLQQDLGDTNLRSFMEEHSPEGTWIPQAEGYYKDALEQLLRFQFAGHEGLDYSLCIPRDRFDRQSMLWDLYHFKYFFLKISATGFDEQKLEDDLGQLTERMNSVSREYFMFRDFQSRNIMIFKGQCYFVDYQGGRRGALQYDPASLLFEAISRVPQNKREEYLDFYLSKLREDYRGNPERFRENYLPFVLIRILQALGTYGLRGWVEKKPLFLRSAGRALENLEWLIKNMPELKTYPELYRVLNNLIERADLRVKIPPSRETLTVTINSFSYRKPLPDDLTGNGGGFVFDCRAMENPGRIPELRQFTGLDKEIQDFFSLQPGMEHFIDNAFRMVLSSVETYRKRDYRNLMVNFGCTGGRHRSVFAAEKLASRLKQIPGLVVELRHRELGL